MSILIVDLIERISTSPSHLPLEDGADLPAVDRRVEDRRRHLELLGAVALAAGVDGHLAHPDALGVAAVLLPRHAARLVGALPEDEIAVRPALDRPAAHPFGLHADDEVDAEPPQFAGDEVVIEQGIRDDHVAGGQRAVQLP